MTKRNLLIFGAGDYAGIVGSLAGELGYERIVYTSDDDSRPIDDCADSYMPYNDSLSFCPPDEYDAILGFVGKDMASNRERKANLLAQAGYSFPNLVQAGSSVTMGTLGLGNVIFAGVRIGYRCVVGSHNVIWGNVVIPHDNEVGSYNNFAPNCSLAGYARVGNHCFIGMNSAVNNGVSVADYALIGAGVFARKDIPANAVLVGSKASILPNCKSIFFSV